ncbi:MAG: response regulator [Polyangiaceae bacterium]
MSSKSLLDPQDLGAAQVVLVIEDEPILRASMVRGLSKLPNIEVFDAGTLRDAKQLLAAYPPKLIVSDLDLPDGSGVEVVGELDRLGQHVPVVFITAYLSRFRTRLPDRQGVELHEKPVSLDRLRQLVLSHVGAHPLDPQPFGVIDYVQLAGMGRRSVVLEVRGHLAGVGRILVHDGEVWTAQDEKGEGLEAFRRLVCLKNAAVSCHAAESETPARTVHGSCENVLLDVLRELDEATAALSEDAPEQRGTVKRSGVQPKIEKLAKTSNELENLDLSWEAPRNEAPAKHETVRPPLSTRAFEELFDLGVDALLAKRHAEAYRYFQQASQLRPNDPSVVANLRRLKDMGFAA